MQYAADGEMDCDGIFLARVNPYCKLVRKCRQRTDVRMRPADIRPIARTYWTFTLTVAVVRPYAFVAISMYDVLEEEVTDALLPRTAPTPGVMIR